MKIHHKAVVAAALLTVAGGAHAFTAYNDLWSTVANEYDGENVTDYTIPSQGTASGPLVDYATGDTPGYTLVITETTAPQPSIGGNGANPALGTDGFDEFGDILNLTGYIQGSDPAGAPDRGSVSLSFQNLIDDMLYEVILYGDRSPADDTRLTRFNISGADDFENASTAGAFIGGINEQDTVIDTAPNNVDGLLARFTNIDPGADGMFLITVSDGDVDTGTNWYVNGLKFTDDVESGAAPLPGTLALLGFGLAGLAFRHRRSARRAHARD